MMAAVRDRNRRAASLARVATALALVSGACWISVASAPEASAAGAVQIASGGDHTCALTTEGGVRCWGGNTHGELGDGTTTSSAAPVDVVGLTSGVVAISIDFFRTCALTDEGGVKCWGDNWLGQLGDGTTDDSSVPVDVVGLTSGVAGIAAGSSHTCALMVVGGVKCWGANYAGQLGNGTNAQSLTPVDVVGLGADVVAVTAGGAHTCALISSGGVQCWGVNWHGEVGDGTMDDRLTPVDVVGLTSGVVAVSAGGAHTCAVTAHDRAKCWGRNFYGQLGIGTSDDSPVPVVPTGLTSGVAAISAGYEHTCAVTTLGGAMCWGLNSSGRLGDGTFLVRRTPVAVVGLDSGVASISAGYAHTCAAMLDGRAMCWGWDEWGQIGDGEPSLEQLTPVEVVGLTPWEVAQPDALISKRTRFIGDDVYNSTGLLQARTLQGDAGGSATFRVQIQNDGDAPDRFTVHGQTPNASFSIVVTRGGAPVTDAFLAGSLTLTLEPGASEILVLEIGVGADTPPGTVEKQHVRATSRNDPRSLDVVRARVTVGVAAP